MLLVDVDDVLVAAPVEPFDEAADVSVFAELLFAVEEFMEPDAEPLSELLEVVLVEVVAPVVSNVDVDVLAP